MMTLNHKFVVKIPDIIEEGTLYISIPFEIAIHKCCCGCGNEVVTPLSPKQWSLTFDGESISLYPSIGSWNLKCQSHYFIRKNVVVWAMAYSKSKIRKIKQSDSDDILKYYETKCKDEEKIKRKHKSGNINGDRLK
jgi:hypothetical protein